MFDLKNIFDSDKIKGSPCFIEQFDEKFDKVLLEFDSHLKIEDGEILYEDEDSVKKLRDFYIKSKSFFNRFKNKDINYIGIEFQHEYSDGSEGFYWFETSILPDQLSKVEKRFTFYIKIT